VTDFAGMPSTPDYWEVACALAAAGQSLRHPAAKTVGGGVVWLRDSVELS